MSPVVVVAVLIGATVFAAAGGFLLLRRRRQSRDEAKLAKQSEAGRQPPSLHPVIDADVCIGSLSCVTACPEGDILGIVDGSAKLIIGSNCIGHGRCALECPVDAIKLVFGTAERGLDLPEVNEFFESSRKGLHIVGELAGMGLIRNALTQGLQVAEHLARNAKKLVSESHPVLIVGAGPAGLATAVGLAARHIPFRIIDQGSVGGTTAHYPRHKIVMTERIELPGYGKFGKSEISKEALAETWQKLMRKTGIKVEEGVKVVAVEGEDTRFAVKTSAGELSASKVVLATGRRGSPRQLGVPGETSDKVTYSLLEPEQYAGQHVLVVGGGDSALEAALALSEEPGTIVSISYRGADFAKCREANRKRMKEAVERKRVQALMSSVVERVDPRSVTLKIGDTTTTVENDFVIACLGGELPHEFLKAAGVEMKRHHGEADSAPMASRRSGADKPSHLGFRLASVGIALTLMLTIVGYQYYLLSPAERMASPMHEALRPAGVWGHGVGIAATLFMMLNFLYPLRKRTRWLKGTAPIRSWLTFHVFVGLMSPVLIGFHAAFHSRNLLATATFVALLIVAVTGIIGRFVVALAPKRADRGLDEAEVKGQLERHRRVFLALGDKATNAQAQLTRIERELDETRFAKGSMLRHLLAFPWALTRMRRDLKAFSSLFATQHLFEDFSAAALATQRLQFQVHFFRGMKRFLSAWRAFHVVLAVLLVLIMTLHIALSLYLGFTWVF